MSRKSHSKTTVSAEDNTKGNNDKAKVVKNDLLSKINKYKDTLESNSLDNIYESVINSESRTLIGSSGARAEKSILDSLNYFFGEKMTEAAKNGIRIDSEYVLHPTENFKGMSYGDILARWNNWLMSSHPYYYGGDILFLRGNMGYYSDPNTFLDMTDLSANGQTIPYGTAIFIPIITCQWNIGDNYEGTRIEDEETMRFAVRDYLVGGGPMWATLFTPESPRFMILDDNLTDYYAESPRFQLNISPKSNLRTMIDDPLEPGDYDAVVGGYCILLQDLPVGKYRIRFGGKGRRVYYTDAVYDIKIVGTEASMKQAKTVEDISRNRHSNEPIIMKYFSSTVNGGAKREDTKDNGTD